MAAGSSSSDRSLEETPTWAVALVCAFFIIISVIIEHGIHSLGKFHKKHKKALLEALEKMKAELMLLGFISLLLTVGTKYVAKICVPEKIGYKMLPCKPKDYKDDNKDGGGGEGEKHRKLLSLAEEIIFRRVLAGASDSGTTCSKEMVPMISYSAVHQLHIFIFILAVFHMKKWKTWEAETTSLEYEFANDLARFRFAHQTSSVKRHTGLSTKPGIRWVILRDLDLLIKPPPLSVTLGFLQNPELDGCTSRDPWKMTSSQSWYEFGIHSCYHESMVGIGVRVGLGVLMGSHMKKSIFEDQTSKALKKWQKAAKERKRQPQLNGDISKSSPGHTPSRDSSPIHLLHTQKHRSSTAESEIDIPPSPRSETELSDMEPSYHTQDHHKNLHQDFSFSRS
ncbi:hypothetical protein L1987_24219 [Smallanthus sonchifolius]|uniref:Uncharacterized protein n=1 Tax=Smallanthus sonchifolius TaxID=185202 RepID=A0ACB9ILB1_9ASTR|nr:hypothetical protein L1987_24219 [Smallanthus sonchifolius]